MPRKKPTPPPRTPTKRLRAAKPAAPAAPAAQPGLRPRIMPRGMVWCGTCKALASAEGSETTPHGFQFCRQHRAKP